MTSLLAALFLCGHGAVTSLAHDVSEIFASLFELLVPEEMHRVTNCYQHAVNTAAETKVHTGTNPGPSVK